MVPLVVEFEGASMLSTSQPRVGIPLQSTSPQRHITLTDEHENFAVYKKGIIPKVQSRAWRITRLHPTVPAAIIVVKESDT